MATSAGPAVAADTERIEAARLQYGVAHISCFAGSHDKRALLLHNGGVVAYRVFTFWLPLLPALALLPNIGRLRDQLPRVARET